MLGRTMSTPPIPVDRGYTDDHTWVMLAPGDAVSDFPVRVGVTSAAVAAAGDPVRYELPAVGGHVKSGEQCGVAVAANAMWDLCAPISGRVTLINPAIMADPGLVALDPYSQGWLFAVLPSADPTLLTAAQYAEKYARTNGALV